MRCMKLRFENLEIDTDAYELRRDGALVLTEPLVFDLISYLVENSGHLVSRDDVIARVWEGRIVSEATIDSCVKLARQALGDSGRDQRIIKTVRGRGFRFVAEVAPADQRDHTEACISDGNTDQKASRKHDREAASASVPSKPSIAVMPFANVGSEPGDELFATGLTVEIVSNLSRFRELFVFSRSTTTALQAAGADIQEVHKRLSVDFVVEGSVRKSPNAVRASVQLTDAATGGHLLVERYERDCTPESVFEIQDEIALVIAGRVASRHGPVGHHQPFADRRGRSKRWDTYNWITNYYQYHATRDADLHGRIRDGLYTALKDAPQSSDGWACLAILVLDEYRNHFNERASYPALDEALKNANKAVSCDAQNAFAYQARAIVHFHRREVADFHADVEQSLELNSGRGEALAEFGQCYYFLGDYDKALSLLDKAVKIDPIQNGQARLVRSGCYFMRDECETAIAELKKSPVPGYFWYHAILAAVYSGLGDLENAATELKQMYQIRPDFEADLEEEVRILCVNNDNVMKFADAWMAAKSFMNTGQH